MSSNTLNQRISRLDQYQGAKDSLGSSTVTTLLEPDSPDTDTDSDFVFNIKKKLIQFWNEPEYVHVTEGKRRKSEDALV